MTKRRITGGAQNCPYPLGIRLSITKLKKIIAEFDGEFLKRQSYMQEGGCLVHFGRLATTLLKDEELTRHVEYCKEQLLLTVVTPILALPG